jgi:plasmid stabilization system protein ParE
VKVDLTTAAIRDLASIDAWYAERAEPEVLIRWRDAAERAFESLTRHPEIGAVIPTSRKRLVELRSLRMPEPFHAYRAFYVLDSEQIRVLRVLHEARDRERWIH